MYKNPFTVTPLLMTSLSSQSLIPDLQIQRIQHLHASLHLFLYYCQLNAPHLTLPPPPRPLPPGPSRQIRKKFTSVWSSRVGAGSIAWLRPERLRTVALSENIQLFRERLSEKMCTRQYTVPDTVAVDGTYFFCFPNLALANSYFHGLSCHSFKFLWRTVSSKPHTVPIGMHFFRQPFSK